MLSMEYVKSILHLLFVAHKRIQSRQHRVLCQELFLSQSLCMEVARGLKDHDGV